MAFNSPQEARRQFLRSSLIAAGGFGMVRSVRGSSHHASEPGLFAEQLALTPRQTEGPFYPNPLPLSQDNDLVILSDSLTPAVGEVTHLYGQVLSSTGAPLKGATVEIWQADSTGAYIHPGSEGHSDRDRHFQGFGRFETASDGRFYFRTIKPAGYPGRTPHIHVLVNYRGKRILTSQLYIRGEQANRRDGILMSIRDLQVRQTVLIDFNPIPGLATKELYASADLIVGLTPDEKEKG